MMTTERPTYSTLQRLCFASIALGFLLNTIGGFPPYWRTGEVTLDSITGPFDFDIPFIGKKATLAELDEGLFFRCVSIKVPGMEKSECLANIGNGDDDIESKIAKKIFGNTKNQGRIAVAWLAFLVSGTMSFVAVLVACCRGCCCKGGRTICHGITVFIAGALGFLTVGLYVAFADDGLLLKLMDAEYGWAIYLYSAGSAILTLTGILMCFLVPNSPIRALIPGQILNQPTSTYVHMHNEMSAPGAVQPQANQPFWGSNPNPAPVQAGAYAQGVQTMPPGAYDQPQDKI